MADEGPKHFWMYKDAKGEWRWRLRANNSKIVADGSQGYTTKAACLHGIEVAKQLAAVSKVWNAETKAWET
jgi:uncharacterized protein YegP (UPF0339 family)